MLDYSPERSNESFDGFPESPARFDVLDDALNLAVDEVNRMFFPWTERIDLIFYNNKACGLQQAFQALKVGDTDRAFDLSLRNLETCKAQPKVKPKILGHAYYNAGMSYMIRNEHDLAIQHFNEAARLRPGAIVSQAMADCRKAKALREELQEVEEQAAFDAEQRQADLQKAVEEAEANSLKNADIIHMVSQGIPALVVVQKIKGSTCSFDTSPEALVELTNAGVTEPVLLAMMEQ